MKRRRAPDLLQGQGNRMRGSVEQLLALPRVLLSFILLWLTPSGMARIACVSSRFRGEALSPQFLNGILMWPSGWLALPRTALFQSYLLHAFRVDFLFLIRFMEHFFLKYFTDVESTQQNRDLREFFLRSPSTLELREFIRLRPEAFQRLCMYTRTGRIPQADYFTGGRVKILRWLSDEQPEVFSEEEDEDEGEDEGEEEDDEEEDDEEEET
jgi:hypothetical protein